MSYLCSIPDDLLFEILIHISAHKIENVLSGVNVSFRDKIQNSNELWRRLCEITGKLALKTEDGRQYRDHYRSIPCVPVDFPTVGEALSSFSERTKTFTITILPGLHLHETIDLCIRSSDLPFIPVHERYYESDVVGGQVYLNRQIVHVCIQAAFPHKFTALVRYARGKTMAESPCINLYTLEDDDGLSDRGLFHLEVKNISLYHYAKGNNIWVGNTVVRVDGSNTLLTLRSCSLQSDSGRGVVVTRGGRLWMNDSTVHDCAATGIYIGDRKTSSLIQNCDIIRCGFGTRRQESCNIDTKSIPLVPPGHSGIYVEATIGVVIDDSLVAGNSLTGLSVVRCGVTALRHCHIIENGAAPVGFEEPADALFLGLQDDDRNMIRGNLKDLGGNIFGQLVPNPKELETARTFIRSSCFTDISYSSDTQQRSTLERIFKEAVNSNLV